MTDGADGVPRNGVTDGADGVPRNGVTGDVEDTVARVPSIRPRRAPDRDTENTVRKRKPAAIGARSPKESPAVARPTAFYSFRVGSEGRDYVLATPAVVGRRPTAPRVPVPEPPQLVRVESPLREVSALHLGLAQIGQTIVVTDLRSTNGSIVMLPGRVARKLLQGESLVVSPGTLVDIGDGNILHILSIQRVV